MKCPKCGYTSFDYLKECKKCGESLDESRESLNLKMGEPTLFADLKDELSEDVVDSKPAPSVSESSFAESNFSPSPPSDSGLANNSSIFTTSSDFTTSEEKLPEPPSQDITLGLGTLGDMDSIQPRPEDKGDLENLPKIELESPDNEVAGLELTPSFSAESCTLPSDEDKEEDKEPSNEAEFSLFEDASEEKTEIVNLLEDDIPFDFSASDLESDISLKAPSDSTDKDLIELELDMEDEESLDQILADLQLDK